MEWNGIVELRERRVRKLLTAKELQQALNISESTLYRLRKAGLPHRKLAYRTIRYDLVEVLEWLEKNGSKYDVKGAKDETV